MSNITATHMLAKTKYINSQVTQAATGTETFSMQNDDLKLHMAPECIDNIFSLQYYTTVLLLSLTVSLL